MAQAKHQWTAGFSFFVSSARSRACPAGQGVAARIGQTQDTPYWCLAAAWGRGVADTDAVDAGAAQCGEQWSCWVSRFLFRNRRLSARRLGGGVSALTPGRCARPCDGCPR
ncbi:hypothetical protein G6F32_016788 [Rhizopus arrhizus]|nr:hypothetical protein G6F32_016788 [Rhizopus arrhizus]